jgi:hypothetical protein
MELIGFERTFDGFIAEGIDTRLKANDRITEFRALCGEFVGGAMDTDGWTGSPRPHDLTPVATGKGDLISLFPRGESRSVWAAANTKLVCTSAEPSPGVGARGRKCGNAGALASHGNFPRRRYTSS